MRHCPSARARPGALLIGMRSQSGAMSILAEPLAVDADFVAAAAERGRPESRFRFAAPCAESGCLNWNGACGIGASLMDAPPLRAAPPACGIRATCRWHAQHGLDVCLRCTAVVTDIAIRDSADANEPHL